MVSSKALYDWLSGFTPQQEVGIDEGGLTLRIVENGVMTNAYYEVGGIPEDIEHAGTLEERYHKAVNCDTDELQLLLVKYDGDEGLVAIKAGLLLASAYNTQSFSVPSNVPVCIVDARMMIRLVGNEHSWNDVIQLLQEHYDWQLKYLPDIEEIKPKEN